MSKDLAEAIEEWLLDLKIEGRSPATIRFYRQHLEPFRDFAGPADLKSLTVDDVRRSFLHYQQHSQAGAFSFHARYRSLRAFWSWAIREGYALTNPVEVLKAPKLPRKIIPTFSPDDVKAMANGCDIRTFTGLRDRALVLLLYDTGIRVGELVGMQLQHVDIEHGRITVTGKGNKTRVVRAGPATVKALWRYLKSSPRASDRVWLSEEKRPLTSDGVRQAIQRVAARAGISGVRASPHTFRHSFAVNYLRNGGNIFDLQTLGGWESLEMVKRYAQSLNLDDALKGHERFSPVDRLGLK